MRKWIYLATGLICAILMSQFPEFYQQYKQRLGGTLDELNYQVSQLDQRASENGYNRFEYIRQLQQNNDRVSKSEGQALVDLLTRQYEVETSVKRLNNIHEHFQLPFMILYLDKGTVQATLKSYVPAIPLTQTSAIYAGGGFVTGYLGMFFLFIFVPKWRRKTKNAATEQEGEATSEAAADQPTPKHSRRLQDKQTQKKNKSTTKTTPQMPSLKPQITQTETSQEKIAQKPSPHITNRKMPPKLSTTPPKGSKQRA